MNEYLLSIIVSFDCVYHCSNKVIIITFEPFSESSKCTPTKAFTDASNIAVKAYFDEYPYNMTTEHDR